MLFSSRKSHRAILPKMKAAKPRMVQLEDRLTPAGFGPDDGATIVESWSGGYGDVKIQPGNQFIVATGSSNNGMVIARRDSLGNIDTSFGSGGKATPALSSLKESGTGLVLQSDGKMIVSGAMTGGFNLQHFVARFKTNGSLDGGFGGGGWNSIDVQPMDYLPFFPTTVGLQSTGKVVIAGDSWGTAPGYPANTNPAVLARFTASGGVDSGKSGFGTIGPGNKALGYNLANIDGYFDLVVQSDDKIVVLGHSPNSALGGFLVVRYTSNGALDSSFDGDGYSTFLPADSVSARAHGIARQADGKLVVVGSCTEIGDTQGLNWDLFVARFNANGSIDTSFGGGAGFVRLDIDGDASVTTEIGQDLVIQPDGKIIAAGYEFLWNEAGDNPRNALVARFNSDGSPDSTFGSSGFKFGTAPVGHSFRTTDVTLQSNGNIIVAGSDTGFPLLMRFFGGSAQRPVGSPLMTKTGAFSIVQTVRTDSSADCECSTNAFAENRLPMGARLSSNNQALQLVFNDSDVQEQSAEVSWFFADLDSGEMLDVIDDLRVNVMLTGSEF